MPIALILSGDAGPPLLDPVSNPLTKEHRQDHQQHQEEHSTDGGPSKSHAVLTINLKTSLYGIMKFKGKTLFWQVPHYREGYSP